MAPSRLENGVRNASFLVLDVGNNTFRLGSCSASQIPSQPFHPITVERARNLTAFGDADTVSSSTDDGSSSSSRNRKRVYKEREDPDWVPEKKERKSSSWSSRTVKSKPGPSISSKPTEVSHGTSIGSNPLEVSPMTVSSPPEYLVRLLKLYYNWRVEFDQSLGEYVYICPSGLAHCSLTDAFDTFLHGTSKYNEKASVSSQSLEFWAPSGSSLQGIPATGNGRGKKGKRASAVVEDMAPVRPIGEPPLLQHDPFHDNGNQSSQIPGTVQSQQANPDNGKTRSCVKDRCLDNEFNQCDRNVTAENYQICEDERHRDGKLIAMRRSVRIIEPLGSETDVAGTSDSNLYLTARGESGRRPMDREEQSRRSECLKHEVRKPDCIKMGVAGNDKRSRIFGVRRSRRSNRKNVLVDTEVDEVIEVENNSLALTESVVSSVARKDEGEPLIPESVLDEETHFSMNDEAERLGCSSMVLLNKTNASDMNPCGGVLGVRRSTRINGKHVPVDDEFDTGMGADDDYLYWSVFTANKAVNEEEEKISISLDKVDNIEGGTLASHGALLKQTNGKRSDCHKLNTGSPASDVAQLKKSNGKKSNCQELETQKQPESQFFLKNEKANKPRTENCSAHVNQKHSLSCAAKRKPADSGSLNGKKKRRRNGGCGLKIRRNKKNDNHEQALTQTKLCILSWLIDSGILTENEKLVCITKNSTSKVSSGLVTRGGIWCECCKEVMPLLKFEAHAGSNLHQPWENIFLLSGKTLMQCLREAWEKEKKERKVGFQTVGIDPDPSDDTCGVCADGGHLICCDSCPSTFHQDCLKLKALPEGSWYCPYCSCAFCTVVGHGSDQALETLRLLTCKQCGSKYHQECAWENDKQEMGKVPSLFCGENCEKIASRLSEMLGTSYPVEGGFSWTLLKHHDEDEGVSSNESVSFITECNVKLSMALTVLNECFVPLLDQRTGVDMLCQAVYNCGSNFSRLNYEGFYTLILEKDEEIISAASLRFHGTKLAEMPFIGTRPVFRRQGMCRRLLKAIEDMLSSLHIEKLVIPAISDLLDTWMTSFSFQRFEPSHKDEIRNLSMVIFPETTLLQKYICNPGEMDRKGNTASSSASAICFITEDMRADNNRDRRRKADELPSSFGNQVWWGHDCSFKGQKDATPERSACELPSSIGDQVWWAHDCSSKQQDATPEPSRLIRDSSFASGSSKVLQPRVWNGSVSESLPIHCTFMPTVDMVQSNSPAGTGIVSSSSSYMNRWFQSGDEAKDIIRGDAISSSLAFDSLFRISS